MLSRHGGEREERGFCLSFFEFSAISIKEPLAGDGGGKRRRSKKKKKCRLAGDLHFEVYVC